MADPPVPSEAVKAAAAWLHDAECNDGEVGTCGRWKAATDPESRFHRLHIGHFEYYEELATGMLEAAAPHLLRGSDGLDVAREAEVLHAEHHPGTFVPSLDSCPEHTRAEYEQMAADLLRKDRP